MEDFEAFRRAGRTLFSLGLVRGAEGNLSAFDGRTLWITRTGAELGSLAEPDLVTGPLEGDLPGASSDLEVHRRTYRSAGPGALVHAHPQGSVPDGVPESGEHGVYEFAGSLARAVEAVVARARLLGADRTPS